MNSNNFPMENNNSPQENLSRGGNIVYKYPLTSCNCVDRENISELSFRGPPTNMSVRNCEVSGNYERPLFSSSIEPRDHPPPPLPPLLPKRISFLLPFE